MRRPSARTRAIVSRSACGTRPSASIAVCTTSAWNDRKTVSAVTYDGPSAMTTSPGSRKSFAMSSSACCEPVVTTTSSTLARMPSSAITSRICSRSRGVP